MTKNIVKVALGSLLFGSLAFAGVSLSIIGFLQAVQVNTTQLPAKGWVRWMTADVTNRGCAWVDFTKISQAPKVGWKPAWDYINQDLIPTFGNPPLTAEQETFCWGDIPAIQYVVKDNSTTLTRPMYDGLKWIATRDMTATWTQTYRIAVGLPCEPEIIRKTLVADYHWATNDLGQRDLTACRIK